MRQRIIEWILICTLILPLLFVQAAEKEIKNCMAGDKNCDITSNEDFLFHDKQDITLKIGLYNFPDFGHDNYTSYKQLIINEFRNVSQTINLDLTIGEDFDPYGDLTPYLNDSGFDILELDMGRLLDFKDLAVPVIIESKEDYLDATIQAVSSDNQFWGYPTLTCGNFLIQLTHNSQHIGHISDNSYDLLMYTLKISKSLMDSFYSNFDRLLSGKITDANGWYLPFIYLDGYIDIFGLGQDQIQKGIDDVLAGNPNITLTNRLKEYVNYYRDRAGHIETSTSQVISNIRNGKSVNYYGFSENLCLILENLTDVIKAEIAISPLMGNSNRILVFTDGLVINKARYQTASFEKKAAIDIFIKFFTGEKIREKIVLGTDLSPPRYRYLLPPLKEFYKKTEDIIYKDINRLFTYSTNAPILTDDQRQSMQDVLSPLILPEQDLQE